MIRHGQTAIAPPPGYRRRMGDAGGAATSALAFNPITAGISAGVGLATAAASLWMNSIQQSHNADTATTLIVNGLESQLKNLDAAYFAERQVSCADQRAALDAYDQSWLWLQSPAGCGAPNFGAAGNRCISDRAPGGQWPWASYYRDPIAHDPRLADAGCDTSQEVILPSLSTGTYAPTGITSTGAADVTTQAGPPAQPGNALVGSPITLASLTSTVLSSPVYLVGIVGFAFLFLSGGSKN